MKLGDGDRDFLRWCKLGGTSYYCAALGSTAMSTLAVTANRFYAMPFFCPINFKIDRIAFNVTILASGNARAGIYEDNKAIYPGNLVLDGGEFSTGTTGVKEATISLVLAKGKLYWLVFCASAAPTLRSIAVGGLLATILGISSSLGTAPYVGYYYPWTYAALPSPYPSSATLHTAAMPGVFLRAA